MSADSGAAPVIQLDRISKKFGTVSALKSVSFSLFPGQIVGLLGDNGAGKSTLIKVLSGVHQPSSGNLYVEKKKVVLGAPREARALGIETVYQDLGLVDELSIARNFFLGAEVTRWGWLRRRKMKALAEEALAATGVRVKDFDIPVKNLSGGERQAIAIARAWYFGSKVLILDEPTSALSVQETKKVFHSMDEAKKRGMSLVFITHNLTHAKNICDRLILLKLGECIGEVSPHLDHQELESRISHHGI